jgi:signal peptidase I
MPNDHVVVNGISQTMPSAKFVELMATVLSRGAPFRFRASGYSMYPFIRDGDVIMIAPILSRLRLGDIAAYVNPSNNRLTVHRVIHIVHNGYLFRGDNCPEPDGYISHMDIIGRVTQVEHRGRRMPLGLGIERIAIAFLSSHGWLTHLLIPIRYIFKHFIKRQKL